MACTTYVNDIFDYLRDSEVRRAAAAGQGGGRRRRGAWLHAAAVGLPGLPCTGRCQPLSVCAARSLAKGSPAAAAAWPPTDRQPLPPALPPPPPPQLKRRPTTTYMESVQGDINPMMRSILLDWLVEVGQEYRLTSDTLFLSAAFIDRFLSLVDVKRNRLQLVGVTCMLVASKYEEIYAPQVEEFCYITDNTYTREQVGGQSPGAGRAGPGGGGWGWGGALVWRRLNRCLRRCL